MPQIRQLAAVMFTDIIGYTACMQENEQKAVVSIKHYNAALNRIVGLHKGKVLSYYGDGCLCTFSCVTEGMNCKEPTDINALADEYLRLSFHALRAKDKSFNATLETDFDETIGNINIIPQDIGRVVLNLITNAFYAAYEKKKSGIENYQPVVLVSTKKINDKVEIKVRDNGNGIPKKILDKIFQPFFTTKPTGQGPGLGLSLAYDIIKAHGGEIKVETKEKDGTAFTIILLNTNI